MVFLFLGPSGSGKDTQAELLQKKLSSSILVSTGDLMREIINNASHPHHEEVSECLTKGVWVPDQIVYSQLKTHLENISEEHIIFTGAIRTAPQIPMLDKQLALLGKKLDTVFYLRLSDEIALERMLGRGREDDTRVNIQSRLDEFHEHVRLISQEYQERGILYEIDANQIIENIHQDVLQILEDTYEITLS